MDITISEAAEELGTTVPRVTRALGKLRITRTRAGRRGRGRRGQVVDERQLARLREHLGATPSGAPFSREEMFVLAALNVSPFGLRSARAVASAAGVSTTTASKVLPKLVANGLVTKSSRKAIDSGRVIQEIVYEANRTGAGWRLVNDQIQATHLPASTRRTEPKVVPRRFWHLFWNAT